MTDRDAKLPEDYWEPLWPGKPINNEYKHVDGNATADTWCNEKCQVYVYDYPPLEGWPPIIEMSLKLNSREPWRDWRDFYRIKSELCGTKCWAIEVYPAQDALVDSCNQYHMFVFPPDVAWPIRLHQAKITSYGEEFQEMHRLAAKEFGEEEWQAMSSRTKQRDWHEHHKCDELPEIGPVWRKRGYFINDEGEVEKGEAPVEEPPQDVGQMLMQAVLGTMTGTSFDPDYKEVAPKTTQRKKGNKSRKKMSKKSRQQNRKRRTKK